MKNKILRNNLKRSLLIQLFISETPEAKIESKEEAEAIDLMKNHINQLLSLEIYDGILDSISSLLDKKGYVNKRGKMFASDMLKYQTGGKYNKATIDMGAVNFEVLFKDKSPAYLQKAYDVLNKYIGKEEGVKVEV